MEASRAAWVLWQGKRKTVDFSSFIKEKSRENCESLQCRQSCGHGSGWWTMASGCCDCIGKIAHLDKQLSSEGTASGGRTCSINHTINHRIVNWRGWQENWSSGEFLLWQSPIVDLCPELFVRPIHTTNHFTFPFLNGKTGKNWEKLGKTWENLFLVLELIRNSLMMAAMTGGGHHRHQRDTSKIRDQGPGILKNGNKLHWLESFSTISLISLMHHHWGSMMADWEAIFPRDNDRWFSTINCKSTKLILRGKKTTNHRYWLINYSKLY